MARSVTVIPASQIKSKAKKKVKTEKIRVAAYCRVSTAQEEQAQSYASQVRYYTDYINKRPDYELAGVYGDEGISGTSLRNREQFKKMIEDCEAGKIDLVIAKSISRFARNTQDCLHYSRMLKNMGIGVYFEKENISTMDAGGELLFTILSSLAQEESRNISENTTWGIRTKFKNGESHLNGAIIMGYDQAENGKMVINKEQAEVVRRIFIMYLEGFTTNMIAKVLNEEGIVGNKGKVSWNSNTIKGMLRNEKYKGDSLLQKTFTVDYLTHKNKRNTGQIDQYYVKGSHPAIVDEETWEAVQLEMDRKDRFIKEYGLPGFGYNNGSNCPYISQVFCGECGRKYGRQSWSGRGIHRWFCKDSNHRKGGSCGNRIVDEKVIDRAIVIAWNSIVENRDQYLAGWETTCEEGDPLERVRAKQMIELTAEGKITVQVPELTRMVLESVLINAETIAVHFLDGTVIQVSI